MIQKTNTNSMSSRNLDLRPDACRRDRDWIGSIAAFVSAADQDEVAAFTLRPKAGPCYRPRRSQHANNNSKSSRRGTIWQHWRGTTQRPRLGDVVRCDG